eukprot:1943224-Amphidinium_carterae.1
MQHIMHCKAVVIHQLGEEELVDGLDATGKSNLRRMAGEQDIIPAGLWTDAMPFSYDRKESVEILSLNFPGAVANDARNCCVVLAAWPKKWARPKTKHRILEQVAWSFQYAAAGVRPQMDLF